MKALISDRAGKSLLAFAGALCLLGLITGEAAGASISGKVTKDTATGPGVNVIVVATMPAPGYLYLNQATTDINGNYTIPLPDMAAGTNFLVFPHLRGTNPPLVVNWNDTIEKTRTIGVNMADANFVVVEGAQVSGSVKVDSDTGQGAKDVVVFALHLDANPALNFKFLGQVTIKDGDTGAYGLLVAPAQTVELGVDKQGKFTDKVVDPPFIDVPVPQSTKPIPGKNFLLIPGITVQGTVKNTSGNAISDALVEAFHVEPDGWVWLDDDLSGSDGKYKVMVAPKPTWETILLRVVASGFVEKRQDVALPPPIFVDIVLSTSVQISGRVTDASTTSPIKDVPVTADGPDIVDFTYTDAQGFYFLDVPPTDNPLGQVVIIHVVTESIRYLPPFDVELLVKNFDIGGIDFQLTPAVNISGKVTDPLNSPPAVDGAAVRAFQDRTELAFALTDEAGLYTLKVAVNQGVVDIRVDAGTFYETATEVRTVEDDDWVVNFVLQRAVQVDAVTITWADWAKNQLTIFATNKILGAKLRASVVDANGTLVTDSKGNPVLNNVQMTFSSKNKQYELRKRVTTNLCGKFAKVTSDKGGAPAFRVICP